MVVTTRGRIGYYPRALPSRRRSTVPPPPATASDISIAPKSLELEQRIARVEAWAEELQQTVDILLKRITAMQAQIDHLSARVGFR